MPRPTKAEVLAPILYGVPMRRYRNKEGQTVFRARGVLLYLTPIGWGADCKASRLHMVWGKTPQEACRNFEARAVRTIKALHYAQRVKPYWRKADLE